MNSPEFGIEVAPEQREAPQAVQKCLLTSIDRVNDVFNGMLAPRTSAKHDAIETIEAAMVSRDQDSRGIYRLACPVGGCAVGCGISIRDIKTDHAFSDWSGGDCAQDTPKPYFIQ